MIPESQRVEGRPRASIARLPLRLENTVSAVDCFLHIAHLRTGSQHSCRLDQEVFPQLVSECIAKRPPSAKREVVLPAYQPDKRVHRHPVTNADAEFPSNIPIKFITSSTFLSNDAPPISHSKNCFQQLVDFATDGHEDNSCKR